MIKDIKITWATRAFSDYRLPVFLELNKLANGNLTLIFNKEIVKQELQKKLHSALGSRAIGMSGEKRIIGKNIENSAFANRGIRIPLQKGLIRSIKNTEPDVLISDGFFQWTYGPLMVNMLKKTPHIMCYERTSYTERNVQWYRVLYRKIAKKWINEIICSGSLCGDYVHSLGYPRDKIHYGHMVADVNQLTQKTRLVTPDKIKEFKHQFNADTVFLYTGQIIPRKGIRELVDAWHKSMLLNNPNVALVLIGDGEQIEEIRNLAKLRNISNIFLEGKVPYDEIAAYYAMADVFIIPTLEDNWSLVVPEAMATGLPVVCSCYNGLWPELIKPENGWVIDPLNHIEFSQSLNKVYEERDSFNAMGINSQLIVQDHTPFSAAEVIWNVCKKTKGVI